MHDEIFEQLFDLGNGDFEHKFSKYQVPGGLPKGGGGGNVEMDACWAFIGGLPPPIALFHNDDI